MSISIKTLVVLATLCMALALFAGPTPRAVHAAPVFVVNSSVDDPDAVLNGVCETATPGQCTFRAALQEANNAGGGTINFNIGSCPCTITPLSNASIYSTNTPVIIDGFTEPGSSPNTLAVGDNSVHKIALDGRFQSSNAVALFLGGGNSTVRGMVFENWGSGAINFVAAGDNR